MADDIRGPGNGLLYVLLGALCLVVVGGGYHVYRTKQDLPSLPQAAAPPTAPPVATPLPAPAAPPGGSERRQNATHIASLVEAARAAIARRDYGAADRALDEAERIDAHDPVVVRTRNELEEATARPQAPVGKN